MKGVREFIWLLLLPLPLAAESETLRQLPLVTSLSDTPLAPLYFLVIYILAQQLFVSSVAFCIAGGLLFGPLYGTLLSFTGAVTGAALSFLASRYLLAERILPYLPPVLVQMREEVNREGWRAVVMIRMLPILPYAVVNYTLGLTSLPLRHFLLPTAVIITPRVAVYAYLGHVGRQALEGGLALAWNLFWALCALVAVTWIPHLFHRRLR